MKNNSNGNYRDYYEILEKIGKGAFGEVYKAKDKKTNELRAIKIFDLGEYIKALKDAFYVDEITEEIQKKLDEHINKIKIEIENMKITSHNNINSVKFYEYFQTNNEFAIVMELCDQNLRDLLKLTKKGLEIREIYNIMYQLNNTFRIIQEKQIIHRDIKLDNILLKYENSQKKNYTVKLTDFGESKNLNIYTYCKTFAGTFDIMAPEILRLGDEKSLEEKYNYKCDLWSIGVVLYELCFKKKPYQGQTPSAVINNIKKNGNKYFDKSGNEKLDDLIRKLLVENIEERLDWEGYFNHPFFTDCNNEITMKYLSKGLNKVKILGKIFVENNKNNKTKSKIIYEEEEYELQEYFENKKKENSLTIKLIDPNNEITDMSYMFYFCDSLTSLSDDIKWNTSKVTDMSYMFSFCESFNHFPDISKWDTSNVTNMSHMFSVCKSLSSLPDISKWKTSQVTNMSDMFAACGSLKSLPDDISNWDTSNIINMSCMFLNCGSLSSLPDLSKWNISKVKYMNFMFLGCNSSLNIPNNFKENLK